MGTPGQVQFWHIEKQRRGRTIRGFERSLLPLTSSTDGTRLAGGTQDGQAWIWDAESGTEVQVIQAGSTGVRLLAFSANGREPITGEFKRQPPMV